MKHLLLAILLTTIVVRVQAAESLQVTRGAISEAKFKQCVTADRFGDYAHFVQGTGGRFLDYLSSVDDQGIVNPTTVKSSQLATYVGRWIFMDHNKGRVFDACMKDPSRFAINL